MKWQTQDITILNIEVHHVFFSYARILSKFLERHIHNYSMLKAFSLYVHGKKSFVSTLNMHVSQMRKSALDIRFYKLLTPLLAIIVIQVLLLINYPEACSESTELKTSEV